ncbi:MAG: TPM domain-containing protein [Myxococcota bacterium]
MIALVSLAAALTVADVQNPRDRGAWVADLADVLPADAEARIDARAEELKAATGAEIAVVTVPDVDTSPKEFATELFARWGVGRAGADDGVLFLLVTGRRRLEMEVGYGLEGALPDGQLGLMQQQRMVPRFRQGDYAGGLLAGVDWTVARLRDGGEVAGATATASQSGEGTWLVVIAVPLAGLALFAGALVWARRQQRKCPSCGAETTQLDEAADDAHLTEGQRAEERVGSRDWIVRACGSCGNVHVDSRNAWFAGHSDCPKCGYRTLATTTATIVPATQFSGGRVRVLERCDHCPHAYNFERATPPLPPPPVHRPHRSRGGGSFGGGGRSGGFSGGGRSRGSFGGGRSGGGGAGSSW